MRGKSVVSRRRGFDTGGGERKAFTLVELLVSISVVSFVAAILLPALSAARRRARFVICANNQRQIVQAVNLCAADNDGFYPESV
ncbi:MAG: type II secretion system protein, partial [Phycisphaerales bacterium]